MRKLLVASALALGCGGLEPPGNGDSRSAVIHVEPLGDPDVAPPVLRLRHAGAARHVALEDYALFAGELSSYHLGRIRRRELPQTLLDRQIPVLSYVEGRDVVVAPLSVLGPDLYSLTVPELGLLAEVEIDGALLPVLGRLWPPVGTRGGTGLQVFCGDAARLAELGPVTLAPTGVTAQLLGGLDDGARFAERCVRLELVEPALDGTPILPPPLAGEVLFEPEPLLVGGTSVPVDPVCLEPARPVGPACLRVLDDRALLSAGAEASLWALAEPETRLETLAAGSTLVVRGFEPGSQARFSATVFDSGGRAESVLRTFTTEPPVPHLVINEVLADPRGPEATSEWIELVNDGATSVLLAEFSLDDALEVQPLPALELEPGGFVVLVAQGYAPEAELDVLPGSGVRVIALPRLSRAGLANAGEILRLIARDGSVVSRWPLRAAPAPGTSLARTAPDAPDDQASSFARHAAPGASPGEQNVVASDD